MDSKHFFVKSSLGRSLGFFLKWKKHIFRFYLAFYILRPEKTSAQRCTIIIQWVLKKRSNWLTCKFYFLENSTGHRLDIQISWVISWHLQVIEHCQSFNRHTTWEYPSNSTPLHETSVFFFVFFSKQYREREGVLYCTSRDMEFTGKSKFLLSLLYSTGHRLDIQRALCSPKQWIGTTRQTELCHRGPTPRVNRPNSAAARTWGRKQHL